MSRGGPRKQLLVGHGLALQRKSWSRQKWNTSGFFFLVWVQARGGDSWHSSDSEHGTWTLARVMWFPEKEEYCPLWWFKLFLGADVIGGISKTTVLRFLVLVGTFIQGGVHDCIALNGSLWENKGDSGELGPHLYPWLLPDPGTACLIFPEWKKNTSTLFSLGPWRVRTVHTALGLKHQTINQRWEKGLLSTLAVNTVF